MARVTLTPEIPPSMSPSRRYRHSGILVLLIPAVIFAILLWVAKWVVLDRRQSGNHTANITQFTTSSGLDLHPSFSPDGTNVAYSSDRSGRFEIYVQPQAGGAREVQITSDGQQNLEPAWSPDGQYIAYTSQVRKGIFVVPALGGIPKRLTGFGAQPSWSADGSQIAFRSEGAYSLLPAGYAPSTITNIWVVSAQGGQPRPITQTNNPAGSHSYPSWNPDGMSILFSNQTGGGADIWSVRVREGTLSRISNNKRPQFSPIYTPDARNVLYVGVSSTGFTVWKTSLSDGRSYEVLPLGLTFPRDMAIDRTGRRIAYGSSVVADRSFLTTLPAFFEYAGTRGNIYMAELPR